MSMTIWKYPLSGAWCELTMPQDALILDIQMQGNQICLWALVDPDKPTELRTIAIRGTGQPLTGPVGMYLATVQDGPYVWHFFEVIS